MHERTDDRLETSAVKGRSLLPDNECRHLRHSIVPESPSQRQLSCWAFQQPLDATSLSLAFLDFPEINPDCAAGEGVGLRRAAVLFVGGTEPADEGVEAAPRLPEWAGTAGTPARGGCCTATTGPAAGGFSDLHGHVGAHIHERLREGQLLRVGSTPQKASHGRDEDYCEGSLEIALGLFLRSSFSLAMAAERRPASLPESEYPIMTSCFPLILFLYQSTENNRATAAGAASRSASFSNNGTTLSGFLTWHSRCKSSTASTSDGAVAIEII
nr:hypothetical protein ACMD2_12101 [Ipomoea batatas]